MKQGIIIVDHGSSRDQSNDLLVQITRLFADRFASQYAIVEPAHMEMAEPSIRTAYSKCVARGAKTIVVCPFFLGPGKHFNVDIPRLVQQAADDFPGTAAQITNVLAPDDLLLQLIDKRICETNHLVASQK